RYIPYRFTRRLVFGGHFQLYRNLRLDIIECVDIVRTYAPGAVGRKVSDGSFMVILCHDKGKIVGRRVYWKAHIYRFLELPFLACSPKDIEPPHAHMSGA